MCITSAYMGSAGAFCFPITLYKKASPYPFLQHGELITLCVTDFLLILFHLS